MRPTGPSRTQAGVVERVVGPDQTQALASALSPDAVAALALAVAWREGPQAAHYLPLQLTLPSVMAAPVALPPDACAAHGTQQS
jgi:hypothetical protein